MTDYYVRLLNSTLQKLPQEENVNNTSKHDSVLFCWKWIV